MLYIHNANILTSEGSIENAALLTEGKRIVAVGRDLTYPAGAERIDAQGNTLVPGFIDLQLNGAFGLDFTDKPETIWEVARDLPRYGVTSFLPTIITSPLEKVKQAQAVLRNTPSSFTGTVPLGLHLEGPFLNPQKRGAHNPNHLRQPNLDAVADWSPDNGVRLVTLAPELPNALDVTRALVSRGVVVSAGHSMATLAEAQAGFEAGITYGTHLFNAMPLLEHREPNLPGALLTDSRITVGIIPDGIHVHSIMVQLAFGMKGATGLNIVTDAMAALGTAPGIYRLGDFDVTVNETTARLSDGRLAGSIIPLDAALRNTIAYTGCSLAEALATITSTPARVLGLAHERGSIAPGFVADCVLLNAELQVVMTIVEGRVVSSKL